MLKVPQVNARVRLDQRAVDAIARRPGPARLSCSAISAAAPLPFELKVAGRGIRPRFPGAAGGAGDERADHAAVPLAHPAADRARLLLGLERTLGVGGAVGLSTAANIFLGMVEAPLFIRPYLAKLSRGELFVVMTGGMAGIAGTVLVLYATFWPGHSRRAGPSVIASVLGAPAAILSA